MFNIGLGELLIVLLVAYVVVGPRDLPKIARWLARFVRRIRSLNREFRAASGWDDLVSETDGIRREVEGAVRQADLTEDLKQIRDPDPGEKKT